MTLTAALLSAAVAAFVAVGESWWQLLLAPVFAILFTQVGFLGHDAGHRQIFGSRKANDVAGLDPLSFTDGLSHLDTVGAGPSRRPASPVPEGNLSPRPSQNQARRHARRARRCGQNSQPDRSRRTDARRTTGTRANGCTAAP